MARRKKLIGSERSRKMQPKGSEETQPPVKFQRLLKVWAWLVANQPFTAYGGCFALGFLLGLFF